MFLDFVALISFKYVVDLLQTEHGEFGIDQGPCVLCEHFEPKFLCVLCEHFELSIAQVAVCLSYVSILSLA